MTGGRNHRSICPQRPRFAPWAIAIVLASSGCATLTDYGQPLVPTKYQLRTGPFIIFSNFPMTDDPPAVRCLQALERDMKQHLDFRPRLDDELVEIYVLDDRNAFSHFLKFYYPELPPRRAFFLRRGTSESSTPTRAPASRKTFATRRRTLCFAVRSAICRSGSMKGWPSTSRPTSFNRAWSTSASHTLPRT